jgi:TM2 domain-containing membrane protein YozV
MWLVQAMCRELKRDKYRRNVLTASIFSWIFNSSITGDHQILKINIMKNLLKKSRKIGIIGLIGLMTAFYGCSDLASVNENPNEPSDARPTYLLTSAQKNLADNYWGSFPLGYFGNLYAQYWSQNQYSDESRYAYRTGVVNNIWNTNYTTLNTLQQIIRQNRNNPEAASPYGNNANQIAVAKTLKAWTFINLTDIWGSIPFQEALGGQEKPSPVYDSQEEVYAGIIEMLTEASDSINVNETAFTAGDVFFDGDAAKWKKMANSLKLRAAMRIADASPQLAQTAASEAVAAGTMNSNDDDALFVFNAASPNNNPIEEAYKTRDDFAVSSTLIDFMNGNDDPRRSAYAEPAVNDSPTDFAGFPYGMAQGEATVFKGESPWSRPSLRVRDAQAPAIFMTNAETKFAEAEAAQRGWISADAATKYEEAIQASMDYWDVSEEDASDYISNNPYDSGNWRENLGRQKWVAMYMQGIQGWSEWRRLDFGLLEAPVDGKLSVNFDAPIALRYPYPTDENNLNGSNVETALSNQGFSEDNQGQKLWWDAQAEGAN